MDAKILLVLSVQHRIREFLKDAGLAVSSAKNFREAQRQLSGPAAYDLVVVDAELPGGSWQDLLECILESKRTCEMIVCSRLGDERLWAEVIQRGAYDLIAEPYQLEEVLRIVQSALDAKYMQRFIRTRTGP